LVPEIDVAKGNPLKVKSLADLVKPGIRIVVGDPKSVCLGLIAQTALQQKGLWDKAQKQVGTYASNCEDILNNLLLGEADAVIGWDMWPRQHPDKVQGIALPAELARKRNIPAAVIKWSTQPEAAKAFIAFLVSDEGQQVFGKHGYTLKP
jgi:molybdate transport system substrate-binding protein